VQGALPWPGGGELGHVRVGHSVTGIDPDYELATDAMDRSGHRYRNKAERVVRDLSVSLSGTHCILLATDTSYSLGILLISN